MSDEISKIKIEIPASEWELSLIDGRISEEDITNWNNKVDPEEGKGLSTNDFSDDYKNTIDDNTVKLYYGSCDTASDVLTKNVTMTKFVPSVRSALMIRFTDSSTKKRTLRIGSSKYAIYLKINGTTYEVVAPEKMSGAFIPYWEAGDMVWFLSKYDSLRKKYYYECLSFTIDEADFKNLSSEIIWSYDQAASQGETNVDISFHDFWKLKSLEFVWGYRCDTETNLTKYMGNLIVPYNSDQTVYHGRWNYVDINYIYARSASLTADPTNYKFSLNISAITRTKWSDKTTGASNSYLPLRAIIAHYI